MPLSVTSVCQSPDCATAAAAIFNTQILVPELPEIIESNIDILILKSINSVVCTTTCTYKYTYQFALIRVYMRRCIVL